MPIPTFEVTLIGESETPDLVIMGSHDVALDVVVGALADRGDGARAKTAIGQRADHDIERDIGGAAHDDEIGRVRPRRSA